MAINPTGESLHQIVAEDDGGPEVMLNLLRFAGGKQDSYQEYMRRFAETFTERYQVQVLYAGEGSTALIAEPGQSWDAVLLVRYPDRDTFSRMVADPEYQAITHLRSEALSEAVLQATRPLKA